MLLLISPLYRSCHHQRSTRTTTNSIYDPPNPLHDGIFHFFSSTFTYITFNVLQCRCRSIKNPFEPNFRQTSGGVHCCRYIVQPSTTWFSTKYTPHHLNCPISCQVSYITAQSMLWNCGRTPLKLQR